MGLIEHGKWTLYVRPGTPLVVKVAVMGHDLDDVPDLERIEVVPAADYQGAVSALVEIVVGGNGAGLTVSAPDHARSALEAMGVDPSTYRGQ